MSKGYLLWISFCNAIRVAKNKVHIFLFCLHAYGGLWDIMSYKQALKDAGA